MTATPTPVLDASTAAERAQPQLVAEIARLRALLLAPDDPAPEDAPPVAERPRPGPGQVDESPPDRLARLLGLSSFERDVLLLAAAVELDGETAAAVARLQGGEPRPTFGLAMSLLPDAHWDALSPSRPLRRWRLVVPEAGPVLASRPLAIDEYVLHALTGLDTGDGPLDWLTRAATEPVPLAPAQERLADELGTVVVALGGPVLVRLDGDDPDAATGVAQRLARTLGLEAVLVRIEAVPEPGPELARVTRLIDRAALLQERLPVLVIDRWRASGEPAPRGWDAASTLADLLEAPVVVATADGPGTARRQLVRRTVGLPEPHQQRALWAAALGVRHGQAGDGEPGDGEAGAAPGLTPPVHRAVEEVAQHYRLAARTVEAIAQEWAGSLPASPGDARAMATAGDLGGAAERAADRLRQLCRERARVALEGLAERLDVRWRWDDLVLPEGQTHQLADLARHVRHRTLVYERWGFGDKGDRGLGISALFCGESGTGKTMAAEVVAAELGLDLYRIDLSAVVSKYIGETEKNLRRLFDAAQAGGAVLLFDEADALFGRRGEVRDSHDRYANLEVAYLLQRMESYRGLAVLTTNLRSNVDRAFLRRLRFVVQFPFPDEALRTEIWRRAFPSGAPLERIDPSALARLHVPGGSIRAIALGAAFAAADAGTPITPEHVLASARSEYAKTDRTLTDSETAGIGRRR